MYVSALHNARQSETVGSRLLEIQTHYPPSVAVHLLAGQIHLANERWSEAEQEFRGATVLDDENEQAHFGLSRALSAQQKWEESAEHALRAVGLVHYFAAAHYQLGIALEGMGEHSRAAQVMEAAVKISPQFTDAHRHLARLYAQCGEVARALQHERAAEGYGTAPRPENVSSPASGRRAL